MLAITPPDSKAVAKLTRVGYFTSYTSERVKQSKFLARQLDPNQLIHTIESRLVGATYPKFPQWKR
jgi:hypothetical protein